MARRVGRSRRRCAVHKTRPRLCVFRSSRHVYAQVIDDTGSHTLATASSLDPVLRPEAHEKTKVAALVGSLVAKRAMDKGVKEVVFDRHGYKYHGRVKALAEGARETGLEF